MVLQHLDGTSALLLGSILPDFFFQNRTVFIFYNLQQVITY